MARNKCMVCMTARTGQSTKEPQKAHGAQECKQARGCNAGVARHTSRAGGVEVTWLGAVHGSRCAYECGCAYPLFVIQLGAESRPLSSCVDRDFNRFVVHALKKIRFCF